MVTPPPCPACAREPFPTDERWHADRVHVTYACPCGHRFQHRHRVETIRREVVEVGE